MQKSESVRIDGAGPRATQSRQPRQVRKEATVTGQCVCSGVPGTEIAAMNARKIVSTAAAIALAIVLLKILLPEWITAGFHLNRP
jgi:hypothetical protein